MGYEFSRPVVRGRWPLMVVAAVIGLLGTGLATVPATAAETVAFNSTNTTDRSGTISPGDGMWWAIPFNAASAISLSKLELYLMTDPHDVRVRISSSASLTGVLGTLNYASSASASCPGWFGPDTCTKQTFTGGPISLSANSYWVIVDLPASSGSYIEFPLFKGTSITGTTGGLPLSYTFGTNDLVAWAGSPMATADGYPWMVMYDGPASPSPLSAIITHTDQTVSSVFVDGTATSLTAASYNVQTSKGRTTINGVNPGVLFYWAKFTSSGTGSQTLVSQTSTAGSTYFLQFVSSGSNIYPEGQTTVTKGYRMTWNSSTGTLSVSGLAAGDYWIGIKFSASSLSGLTAPGSTSATYGFTAGAAAGTAQSLALNKKA